MFKAAVPATLIPVKPRSVRKFSFGHFFNLSAIGVLVFIGFAIVNAAGHPAPAKPMPDISLPSNQGTGFLLSSERGRMVFLDFWASWCQPCREMVPSVEAFARQHPEVDVVAINVGESPAHVEKIAKKWGIQNLAFDIDGSTAKRLGVTGFPTLFVIDSRGNERLRVAGFNPSIASVMADSERQFSR